MAALGEMVRAACSKRGSLADLARAGGDVPLAGWRVSGRRAPSGWEWQGSQSGEGATELVFPGPTLGQMQGEATGRAGEPSGEGEEPPPEDFGGHHLLAQPDAARSSERGCAPSPAPPARRRWRRSAPRGDGFNPTPYLRSRMAFSISAWRRWSASSCQGIAVPVGDAAVVAVGGEEGPVGNRAWAAPAGR